MKKVLTTALRNATLLALAVLVSGTLPILVQGYGWIDMARKAGGISKIGEIVVDAPPCHICHVAQELQKNSHSDDKVPVPVERIDFLKTMSLEDTLATGLTVPSAKMVVSFPIPADSQKLHGLSFVPGTPPPRAIAA